jgi:ArsR family transcriptional regulator, virulence genes transcriptional regulator
MLGPKQAYEKFEWAALVYSVLGNKHRLRILFLLEESEMTVGDIADRLQMNQSALSQNLAKLRWINAVEARKHRQLVYYRCNSPVAKRLLNVTKELFGPFAL